jgi:hypothetical protein
MSLAAALACVAAALPSIGGTVLLDETWADGTRTDTDLPNESAVFASAGGSVTVASRSLSDAQCSSPQRLITYFTPAAIPAQLDVGDVLTATIEFVPKTMIYNSNSRNLRLGLFYDPTGPRVAANGYNDPGGGTTWGDAEG